MQERQKWLVVGPLWERGGKANDLKRSFREYVKELALCTELGAHETSPHPVVLSTTDPLRSPCPGEAQAEQSLRVRERMRRRAKASMNEE